MTYRPYEPGPDGHSPKPDGGAYDEAARAENDRIEAAIADGRLPKRPPIGPKYLAWSNLARSLGIITTPATSAWTPPQRSAPR